MKPDQAESLRRKMRERQMIKPELYEKKAKTLAVISGKGGVGKSNLTLNMAVALQEKGKKALIIDLDIGMGNIDVLIGAASSRTIIDVMENRHALAQSLSSGPKGLRYISGGTGLEAIYQADREKWSAFMNGLSAVLSDFDYVLFDMGAGLSKEQLPFILSAEDILAVTTPEPTAIMDAYSAIKHLLLADERLTVNIAVNRARAQKQALDTYNRLSHAIHTFLGAEVRFAGSIPDDPLVSQAVIDQVPFLIKNPQAKASRSVRLLTDVLFQTEENKPREEKPAFIERLSSFLLRRTLQ